MFGILFFVLELVHLNLHLCIRGRRRMWLRDSRGGHGGGNAGLGGCGAGVHGDPGPDPGGRGGLGYGGGCGGGVGALTPG